MSSPAAPSAHVAFTSRAFLFSALAMAGIVLLSNILVQIHLNDWLTWGAFSYPIAYFVTDVCNRRAGPGLARRIAWLGFTVGVISSAGFALFQEDPRMGLRIAGASGCAFIVSQLLDIAVFNKLRQHAWWKAPLIGSVLASIIDTAIFFGLAFGGTEISWLHLAVGDLGVKLAMAVVLLAPFRILIRKP